MAGCEFVGGMGDLEMNCLLANQDAAIGIWGKRAPTAHKLASMGDRAQALT